MSSIHSYLTLSKLRIEYLTNLGHETLRSIHLHSRAQIRNQFEQNGGHNKRPEEIFTAAFWKGVLEENFSYNQKNLVFLAVLDESGNLLAGAGETTGIVSNIPQGLTSLNGTGVFVMDSQMRQPGGRPHRKRRFNNVRKKRWESGETSSRKEFLRRSRMRGLKGRQFRIGLSLSPADFIMKQARIHLLISGLAILALIFLAFYLLRTLRRFIILQEREKSERHLTTIGRMGATLAHEIRNPLGAMKGLSQLVQERLRPDDESQKDLTTVVSEAERLEHLVTELLSYAKPKTLKIERIDLNNLFNEIADVIQHKADEAKVSVTFHHEESKASIHSDKDGLRQVLLNVIVNAIEATPIGKNIQVNTTINDKKELVVVVIDEGEGLGNKTSEEVFEPFMTTKLKGTGLGLSISRKIIETLSGTIYLMNNHGIGAKCIVKVPVAQ